MAFYITILTISLKIWIEKLVAIDNILIVLAWINNHRNNANRTYNLKLKVGWEREHSIKKLLE